MTRTIRTAGHSLIALAALALIVLPAREVRSQGDKPSPLEGAWKQVEQKNGDAREYQKFPEGVEFINLVTGGRFAWTVVSKGRVVSAAGGKYRVDGGKYTETLEYVSGQGVPESFVGSTFDFTCKIEGDILHKVGTIQINGQDYKIDEKWERCK